MPCSQEQNPKECRPQKYEYSYALYFKKDFSWLKS